MEFTSMSVISRYEVRLQCMTLATELSGSQEPLDQVFEKAEKIYGWVNQVGNVNKKRPSRNETRNEKPHKPTRYNPQDRHREQQQQQHYRSQRDSQPDMFD